MWCLIFFKTSAKYSQATVAIFTDFELLHAPTPVEVLWLSWINICMSEDFEIMDHTCGNVIEKLLAILLDWDQSASTVELINPSDLQTIITHSARLTLAVNQ